MRAYNALLCNLHNETDNGLQNGSLIVNTNKVENTTGSRLINRETMLGCQALQGREFATSH